MKPNLITLRVRGDFACFTRPEMKIERVSYPVMTPSAARAFSKPSSGNRKCSISLTPSAS